MMKGKRDVPVLQSLCGTLLADLDRTLQVLTALDSMSCKWDRQNWFRNLGLRIRYGVEADLVELCQIPNVGAARAKKLKASRIKNIDDFVQYDAETLSKVMKCSLKLSQESLEEAKKIQLKDSVS
jgi:replicative superfamily II helicase